MSQETMKLSTVPHGCVGGPRHPVTYLDDTPFASEVKEIEMGLDFKGLLEKKGLARFAITHCARRMLPYGIWHCTGGRQVLFNREYQPIAEMNAEGEVSYSDRDWVIVGIERAEMLYDDSNSPIDYLTKHMGDGTRLDASDSKACRRALLRCLGALRRFTPKEHASVSDRWSVLS